MILLVFLSLLLSGCNPFGAFRPTSDELQSANWAPNPDDPNKKSIQKKSYTVIARWGIPFVMIMSWMKESVTGLSGKRLMR